jgi:hypothetical protein
MTLLEDSSPLCDDSCTSVSQRVRKLYECFFFWGGGEGAIFAAMIADGS